MNLVKLIVIGAGNRGTAYAGYATKHSDLIRVVEVAEANVPPENIMAMYETLAELS